MSTKFSILLVFAAFALSTSNPIFWSMIFEDNIEGQHVFILEPFFEHDKCTEPNQEFDSCGTPCPVRCVDHEKELYLRPCMKSCRIGCRCKPGYIREGEDNNGQCILPSQC